jgi:hypothetical protein
LLYKCLYRQTVKWGGNFAFIIWFFRVVMYATTQWITINVPIATLLYIIVTGLIEMVLLFVLYGITLKP